MKLTERLNRFTMGATLSIALAFLIIHPATFGDVQAQSTSEYELRELVERISPPIDEAEVGLNPFYAGRPLEPEYLIVPNFVCLGICMMIFGLALGFTGGWLVNWVLAELNTAWSGLQNRTYRKKFEDWAAMYGSRVGEKDCDQYQARGQQHINCLVDVWDYFIREFVREANTCRSNREGPRGRTRAKFDPASNYPLYWDCYFTVGGSSGAKRILSVWSTTPWTR